MTPDFVAALVQDRIFILLALALVTLPFWSSAIFKCFNWQGAVAEMQEAGLSPAAPFAAAA